MSTRPAGAPILNWSMRRDWLDALAQGGADTDALAARFGSFIAREAIRFAQARDVLFLIAPSLGGQSALVAAAMMRDAGHRVRVAVDREFTGPADPDGSWLGAFHADLDRSGGVTTVETAASSPLVIDASLTALECRWRWESEWLTAWRRLIGDAETAIAIDNIPFAQTSGHAMYLVDDHPRYTATIALGALGDQHVTLPVARYCGHLLLAPADPAVESDWRVLGRPRIAPPDAADHKYSRGLVVVVAGAMPGATRLAARAAASAGAGYVILAGQEGGAGTDAIVHRRVECASDLAGLLDDDRIGAVVIGPGLGTGAAAREMLDVAMASRCRLVLDGDALTLIGRDGERLFRASETWITPHAAERTRMTGDAGFMHGKLPETAWWAQEGIGIISKGADTVIATPHEAGVLDRAAPVWLSTAGTGDVLAGVLAARLATRAGDWSCGHEAAWLHLRAAELAGPAFTADGLIPWLPHAIRECL